MSGLFAWLFGRERNRRGASVTVVERTRTDTPTERPARTRTSDPGFWPDTASEAPSVARPTEPASSGAAAAAAAAGGALAIAAGVAHADRVGQARPSDDDGDVPDGGEPSLDAPDGPADGPTDVGSDGSDGGDGGGDGGGGDGGDGGGGDGGGD